MKPKFGVLTIKATAESYGLHQSTVHRAIKEGKFKPGEFEKQEGIYLLKESAVKRVFKKEAYILGVKGGN